MDLQNILVTICGVGCVCMGGVALVLMVGFRFFGGAVLTPIITAAGSLFGGLFGGGKEEDELEEEISRIQKRDVPRSTDFRARAQSMDFDSQVAQKLNQQREEFSDNSDPYGAQSAGVPLDKVDPRVQGNDDDIQVPPPDRSDDVGLRPPNIPSLRNPSNRPFRDRRANRNDARDDEFFGGMLDEDGDGYPDS